MADLYESMTSEQLKDLIIEGLSDVRYLEEEKKAYNKEINDSIKSMKQRLDDVLEWLKQRKSQ